ncbi:putative disease resistance RPP13-like protein 1 [Chenopodium quinoa]|uniref:putative disease resistance RPP13-like protein 1 n=1 Tax=Chenopodium quinoa TaxID=63459 RepID=UPI000B76D343|nr:putative disease resistance RPP13-like protein 1 [Chenopodium quinoa]
MAIGEIFLSAFIQVLFEKLANLASAGISPYLKKTKQRQHKSIGRWQQDLRLIEAVLSDAEQQQLHSNAVKVWLQDLQDLAFDLEDVLDEFVTEARIHELGNDALQEHDSRFGCSPFCKVQVPSFLASSSKASKLKSANYSDTIEQISSRLQDILTQSGSLGLSPQTQSREEQRGQISTDSTSLVREPQVYGRGDEKDEIIRRLLEDDPCWENYVVVPVVGKGGIGKTTLAQCVYNDEQVKNHFNFKAWVCVSDVFDVKQITTTIINSDSSTTHNFIDLNEAHVKLKNLLADKRFLIVLDDVWSDEYDPWDKLQIPFQTAAKGSRVLVTTRLERVAKNMLKRPTQSPIIYLKGLSDDDCWLLFQQHALVDDNLIEMRDEVVKLFKGLPLAAKALGGLLRKEDKSKWSKILQSNVWSEESGVLPSLRLSYHHLPQHLKRILLIARYFLKIIHT